MTQYALATPLTNPKITNDSAVSAVVSCDVDDPTWDSYLAKHPAGHHVQTSFWSGVKADSGWKVSRVKLYEGDSIVGGAQLLSRDARFPGKIGYVPKGPIVSPGRTDLFPLLMQQLLTIAASSGVKALFVQPPDINRELENLLEDSQFRPCPVETAPSATVLVDLQDECEVILSRMTKSMRNSVRKSLRKGIQVREGNRCDLKTFHTLLLSTSQRRGFTPFSLEYFYGMWDQLAAKGFFKLFIGELDDEPVSAQIVIPFGDTVTAKQIGWSGRHGKLRPNEALDWATIQWARSNRFRYYDLEGIERDAATAIVHQQPLPKKYVESPTAYKLRLGGTVHLYPQAWCFLANPILRSVYNRFGYRAVNWPVFQKAVNRFRTSQ